MDKIKIYKYPTRYIIKNIGGRGKEKSEIFNKITRALSVWDENYFKYVNPIYKYDEATDTIYIPGSMSKYKLNQIFDNIEYEEKWPEMERRGMGRVNLKLPPRDELQKAAIGFLKGNEYSTGSTHKLLSLKTGKGKTYCAINYCVSKKVIPLIFVDQETLMSQWKNAILEFTDVEEDQIYMITGQKSIENLFKMTKKDMSKIKFFIAMHRTMSTYLEDNFNSANDLVNKTGAAVKIFDEAHVEIMSMFQIDECMDIPSIYLTATPSRSNPKENIMYKNAIKEAKIFSMEKGYFKQEAYLNILLVKTNSNANAKDQCKFKNKYGFDTVKYSIYQENNIDFFYDKIKRLVKFANKNANRKIAILVHKLNMVKMVTERLREDFPDLEINRFDSTVKKELKDKIKNDSNIIVTTDMSFSKAIDCKGLEVLINLVPVNSATKNEQMLGRLREIPGKEVWYFDLIDAGIPMINDMLNKKKKVYVKLAKNIKDVVLK